MKTTTAIVLLVLAGVIGGGLGLGYEATFFMFGDDYRYRVAEGTPLLRASVSYIVTNFVSAFVKGWAPCLLCLPLLVAFPFLARKIRKGPIARMVAPPTFGIGGAAYGIVIAYSLYAMIGGWGPSGLIGLALSGLFIGSAAPFLFRRREGFNQMPDPMSGHSPDGANR